MRKEFHQKDQEVSLVSHFKCKASVMLATIKELQEQVQNKVRLVFKLLTA